MPRKISTEYCNFQVILQKFYRILQLEERVCMMLDFYASHCHASVKKALNGVLLLCAYARLAKISIVIQQNYRKMCFPWSIWSVVSVIKMQLQFLFNSGSSEIHFFDCAYVFCRAICRLYKLCRCERPNTTSLINFNSC
jgi:hypothetical protein